MAHNQVGSFAFKSGFLTKSVVLTIELNVAQIESILITIKSIFITIKSIFITIELILRRIESILETHTTHFWDQQF